MSEEVHFHGDAVSMAERLVVSPAWGRLRVAPLRRGQAVDAGMVIGTLQEGDQEIPLVSHTAALFWSWLAHDGERVSPGKRLAALRLQEALD